MSQTHRPPSIERLTQLVTHYGNMRFAMFTVFSGLLGALISFPFTDGGHLFLCAHQAFQAPLSICGIVLSLLFTGAELRIASLLNAYQNLLYEAEPAFRVDDHEPWAVIASITMVAPFVLSALFWLCYWLEGPMVQGCPK